MNEKLIGCHLTNSKGYKKMAENAIEINASTFQFFSRNPRGTKAKDLNLDDIASFNKIWKKPFVAHAPYILNLCSSKENLRELAIRIMIDDMKRLTIIGCPYYNIHPGSHTQQGEEIGITQIAYGINEILKEKATPMFLLETMSGKGTEVGKTFQQLREIRNNIDNKERVGFLLDTCHIFDGGYDIINNLDKVLEDFDKTLGIDNLKAIHLNDSKNILNSHKDRHEKLGEGNIGIVALEHIINHTNLKDLPFILETPNDTIGYKKEIELVRNLSK
ncbi:MAG: deoxyribonuclease IV [Spirochaetaceae bacterium]|nr:deoxyribonuclease IV [Spirochaetaceae bacterium]